MTEKEREATVTAIIDEMGDTLHVFEVKVDVLQKTVAIRICKKGYDAGYDAGVAAERERIVAELEDIMQGGDEWRRYDEALREAVKIVKGGGEGR